MGAVCRSESEPRVRQVYTLDECIEIGLQQAAVARNALRDEQIAGRRIGQVRAQLLPQVSGKGSYTRLDSVPEFEFDGERFVMGREDNYAAKAEVSQLLYAGGSVGAALKAASLYRDSARAQVLRIESELVRDIRVAFAGILLADAQVEVQAASLSQWQDLLAQAEARFRQETASEYDVLAARVRVANEQPALLRARKQAELARVAFRNLVQFEAADFDLDGDLVFEPFDRPLAEWQALATEQRPELLELRNLLGMREAEIRAERGGGLPQVRAFAGYSGENPESGSSRDEWEWGWNAGVSLEWSLFDGALRRNRVAELKLELEKARESLADVERRIALEIQSHFLDLQLAAETVTAGAETVELAQKGLDIARTRYENGLATYLDYTEANLALSTARLTHLQARHDHMNALARLRQASGETFETGDTQ